MITSSNPFLRNDYYPDQNDIDDLNTRINEVQSDVDLLAISVNEKTEAVNGRLNNLQNDYNESFETDALKANTADLNVLNVNSYRELFVECEPLISSQLANVAVILEISVLPTVILST